MDGGGGSSYGKPLIERLSKVAEKSFEKAEPQKRNVFISFDHRDAQTVNLLRGQAKNENNDLEFNDYSLKAPFNSERAEYIRAGIREKIRQASVTVIFISDVTHESKWVEWEARESRALGKGVICVHQGDVPPRKLPRFIQELDLKLIPWKHSRLAEEIENASKER
jgi:hypothetical protein